MKATTTKGRTDDALDGLPRPRPGSRWRWATPRRALAAGGALVAGGALAAGLGLGVSSAGATTASSSSSSLPANPAGASGPQGPSLDGGSRPTVGGRITALNGDDITVQSKDDASTTVIYSSSTTFDVASGPNGATSSSSASALKVGALVGAQGTDNADGTVTASSVTILETSATKGGPAPGQAGSRSPTIANHPPAGAPSA
jgi:hypothetical protein